MKALFLALSLISATAWAEPPDPGTPINVITYHRDQLGWETYSGNGGDIYELGRQLEARRWQNHYRLSRLTNYFGALHRSGMNSSDIGQCEIALGELRRVNTLASQTEGVNPDSAAYADPKIRELETHIGLLREGVRCREYIAQIKPIAQARGSRIGSFIRDRSTLNPPVIHPTPPVIPPPSTTSQPDYRSAGRQHIDAIPDQVGPYTFTHTGAEHEANARLYNDLYKVTPREGRENARDLGLIAAQEADVNYHGGALDVGNFYQELGTTFLDIAVGLDPVTGFGRSAYELFTGNNLITGERLGRIERSMAFVGLATFGGSRFIGQAGRGMWRIYERAGHLLAESHLARDAISRGERFVEQGGRALRGWSSRHRITRIESASAANTRLGLREPPYLPGSHVVHFETTAEHTFVRVHGVDNQARSWMVRSSEIRGLTPTQIRDRLNLPSTPTHVSDVRVPSGTPMSRGSTNGNMWDHGGPVVEGQVQYRLEVRGEEGWFRNMRELGEQFL